VKIEIELNININKYAHAKDEIKGLAFQLKHCRSIFANPLCWIPIYIWASRAGQTVGSRRFRKGERRSSTGNKSPAFQLGPLLVSDNRASSGRTDTGLAGWLADA